MYYCDSQPYGMYGGDWKGHVLPGTAFLIWGLHWLQGSLRRYYSNKPEEYRSLGYYGLSGSSPWPIEGVIKMVLTVIGGWLELTFQKENGYTRMICKPGTAREGHLNGKTVHNWQHFSAYPGFFISGIVDFVYHYTEMALPRDGEKVFLGLAFFNEGLIMLLHKKHDPLDVLLHQTLGYVMLATALSIWAEVVWPQSFTATLCRVGTVMGQGLVLWITATLIRGSYLIAWDQVYKQDQIPAQYAAVLIVQGILGLQCLFAVLAAISSLQVRERPPERGT